MSTNEDFYGTWGAPASNFGVSADELHESLDELRAVAARRALKAKISKRRSGRQRGRLLCNKLRRKG